VSLVTGGAGFIGSNLVDGLLGLGHEVRVIDNFLTGKPENISHVLDRITFIEADIRDTEAMKRAAEGADYIFHEAALPSVPRSVEDPLTTNDICTKGTLSVLEAARNADVRRVVYAGSSSAYGDKVELPAREDSIPAPISPYGVAKLTGEYYCRCYQRLHGLPTVVLRYFNIFGPRQDPSSPYSGVISLFFRAMLAGERPVIYGDGTASRGFTYVENVVRANILAAQSDAAVGGVFNISAGERTTINELAAAMNGVLGTKLEPGHTAPRPGDIQHSWADISKARDCLGYTVEVPFEEGLRRTAEWFQHSGGAAF